MLISRNPNDMQQHQKLVLVKFDNICWSHRQRSKFGRAFERSFGPGARIEPANLQNCKCQEGLPNAGCWSFEWIDAFYVSSAEVFLFVFPLDFNDFLSSFTLTCCLRPFLIGFMLSFILSCPGCSAGKAKCGSKRRRSRRVKKIEGSLGRVAQWQHSLVFTLLLLSRRLLFCSILWIKTWLEIKSLTRDLVSSAVRR